MNVICFCFFNSTLYKNKNMVDSALINLKIDLFCKYVMLITGS